MGTHRALNCILRNMDPRFRGDDTVLMAASLSPVSGFGAPLIRDRPPWVCHGLGPCSKLLPPVPDCSTRRASPLRPLMFRPRVISSRGYEFSCLPVGAPGRAAISSCAPATVGAVGL